MPARLTAAPPGRSQPPWVTATNALFAHGRLDYDRGRSGAARKLLKRYIRRYPNGQHAEVARKHFAEAYLEDMVEVRVGDAHRLLADLSSEGPFDFIFIPFFLAYAFAFFLPAFV